MGWYSVYQIVIGILFTWTEIVYENHHKTIDLKNNVDRRQGAALRDEGKSSTLKKRCKLLECTLMQTICQTFFAHLSLNVTHF